MSTTHGYHLGNFSLTSQTPTTPLHLGDFYFPQLPTYDQYFQTPHLNPFGSLMVGTEFAAQQFHFLHRPALALEAGHVAIDTAHHIQADLSAGHPPTETVVCHTVGGATELALTVLGNAGLTLGVAAFAAEATVNPPMLAATPSIANMVSMAHHNVGQLSQDAAHAAEQYCHTAFVLHQLLTAPRGPQ